MGWQLRAAIRLRPALLRQTPLSSDKQALADLGANTAVGVSPKTFLLLLLPRLLDRPSPAPAAQLAMEWGTNHEPNGLMALLCSLGYVAQQLPGYVPLAPLSVKECGLAFLDQSKPRQSLTCHQ
jgi:hypothetical protein